MLYSVEPRSSQWPSIVTRTCGYERKNSAVFDKASRASGRKFAPLKSKNASFTFCSKSSLMLWLPLLLLPVVTGAAPTVTRALAVALPPVPVTVIVYVVDVCGCTGVEPVTETFPTPGSMSASVASVDCQFSVTVSPAFAELGDALIETVGCGAVTGGGGAFLPTATVFLQPPATSAKATNATAIP